MRPRPLPCLQILGLALLVAIVFATNVGASCCVGTGCETGDPSATQEYSQHGLHFQYPKNWTTAEENGPAADLLWSSAIGLDNENYVLISAYKLTRALTAEEFDSGAVDRLLVESFADADAKLDGPATTAKYGGLPALVYSGVTGASGKVRNHRWAYVFNGDIQYAINCLWAPAKAALMTAGCDRILATLKAN